MGADMLIASFAFKRGKNSKQTQHNVEHVLTEARKKIESAKTLDDLGQREFSGDFDLDLDNDVDSEGYIKPEALSKVKEILLRDLQEVRDGILGSHREANIIKGGGGLDILVSGGLSWGDAPAGLFMSINRLQQGDLLDDLRFRR